jgi:hypothetical protein
VQLRALVGGTTAIQGWPAANQQHVQVLRDIDEEGKRELIYTSQSSLGAGSQFATLSRCGRVFWM